MSYLGVFVGFMLLIYVTANSTSADTIATETTDNNSLNTTATTTTTTTTTTITTAPPSTTASTTSLKTPSSPPVSSSKTTLSSTTPSNATPSTTLSSTSPASESFTTQSVSNVTEGIISSESSSTSSFSSTSTTSSTSSPSPSDSSSPSTPTPTTTTTTTTPIPIPTTQSTPTTTEEPDKHVAVIVGVVVGVGGGLIVIAMVIILLLILHRKGKLRSCCETGKGGKPNYGNGTTHIRMSSTDSIESLRPFQPLEDQPVKVTEFLAYVSSHQKDMRLYKEEFEKLPGPNVKSRRVAKEKAYNEKNRYINILPFDENRVELRTDEGGRCYVNASYIDGHDAQKVFIATQGPQEKTVEDFWLMVWQMNCNKVVMVTNLMENFKIKCVQYWPREVQGVQKFNKISVRLAGITTNFDYSVRELIVRKDGEEERVVRHFHFTTWPDQGVPETCTSLLKFHNTVFQDNGTDASTSGPVVIHCSAGVGRSGTLIAVNILLKQAAERGQIDILKCIETLRMQRMYMVQTPAQFIFIHHVMLEALLLRDVVIPDAQFASVFSQLCQPEGSENKSQIQRQFEVLDIVKPRYSDQLYSVAKSEANASKNRSCSTLPADCSVVCLRPVEEDDNTYINAVFVNGFHRPQGSYIATQMPLQSTANDFWRLVLDSSSSCIVMLNDLDNNNDCEQYWPADGNTATVGKFTITNIGPEISSNNIMATNLKVTYTGKRKGGIRSSSSSDDDDDDEDEEEEEQNSESPADSKPEATNPVYANVGEQPEPKGKSFIVRHMRVLNWPNGRAFPDDKTMLLSLYSEVVVCQKKTPNGRVLIHCLHGCERTGLFCAMVNMLDQLDETREVDVFNSVKRVRQARPEFVENFDDYMYLYQLAASQIQPTMTDYSTEGESALYSNIAPRPESTLYGNLDQAHISQL